MPTFTENRYFQSIAFLFCILAMVTIWLPFREKAIFLLLGILMAILYRHKWRLGSEVKLFLVLFIIYLMVFTALSEDIKRSIKGAYDILRGLLLLPVGMTFGALWLQQKYNAIFLMVPIAIVLLGNYFYPVTLGYQLHFFGYNDKPNDISELFLGALLLSLIALSNFKWKSIMFVFWSLIFIAGTLLMVLASSRGVFLSFFISISVFIILNNQFPPYLRKIISGSIVLMLMPAVTLLSQKGINLESLSIRKDFWENIYTSVTEHSPLLGLGINYPSIPEIGLLYNYAHNIPLEIYASSGILGIVFLSYILYQLIYELLKNTYNRTTLYFTGIAGLCAFIILGMLNLRFSSFSFIASMSLFFGVFYSQAIIQEKPPS